MGKKLTKKVPELRFSEFEGDWKKAQIKNHIEEYKERVDASTNLSIYISSREGLKPQIEYFANRELKNEGEYGVVPHGFFVYRHMSDDLTFKFNINQTGKKIAVSKEYPVFKTTKELNSEFILCKLNHGKDFKQFAIIQKKGGTRTRLYYKNLCTWNTLIPKIEEQEKIASFLGAIADRLANLRRKKELLETYKKGVMQKIFSQEIHFKQDNGSPFPDWQIKKFKEVTKINQGLQIAISERLTKPVQGSYFYITNEFLKENAQSQYYIVNPPSRVICTEEDILMTRTGNTGQIVTSIRGAFHNNFFKIDYDKKKINKKFLFEYLILDRVQYEILSLAGTSTIPDLNHGDFYRIQIPLPTLKEQENIADFLTSIDKKNEAVAGQIEAVEQFKKGLLQKMFV